MESSDDEIIENYSDDEEMENIIIETKMSKNTKIQSKQISSQNQKSNPIKNANTLTKSNNNNNSNNANKSAKSKQIVKISVILPQKTQMVNKPINQTSIDNILNKNNTNPFKNPETKPKFKNVNELYNEIKVDIDKKNNNNNIINNGKAIINVSKENNIKIFTNNKYENIPQNKNSNNNIKKNMNNSPKTFKKIDKLNENEPKKDNNLKRKINNDDNDDITSNFRYNNNQSKNKIIKEKRGLSDRNKLVNNTYTYTSPNEEFESKENINIKKTEDRNYNQNNINSFDNKKLNKINEIKKENKDKINTIKNKEKNEEKIQMTKKYDLIEIPANDPQKIKKKRLLKTKTPKEELVNTKLNIDLNKNDENVENILGNINKMIKYSKNKITNDLNKISDKKDISKEDNINLKNENHNLNKNKKENIPKLKTQRGNISKNKTEKIKEKIRKEKEENEKEDENNEIKKNKTKKEKK